MGKIALQYFMLFSFCNLCHVLPLWYATICSLTIIFYITHNLHFQFYFLLYVFNMIFCYLQESYVFFNNFYVSALKNYFATSRFYVYILCSYFLSLLFTISFFKWYTLSYFKYIYLIFYVVNIQNLVVI